MVFVISVTGANRLSLDLFAMIALCKNTSLVLTAIIALCAKMSREFACLDWSGPTRKCSAICDVCCQLSLDLIAIIALRFYIF